jgi:outer membrane receptor protein involved in Fe transport
MDMYDPVGFPLMMGFLPTQAVQRAEVVSGPGGVLWGANSFVGVVNIVSKTADDVDGLEAGIGFGTGANIQNRFRAYFNVGQKFLNDKLKVFLHASVDIHHRNNVDLPLSPMGGGLSPSNFTFITNNSADDAFWQRYNVVANAQYGAWSFNAWSGWGLIRTPLALNGIAVARQLPEDQIDCSNPANQAICAQRVDPTRIARKNGYTFGNNIGILRYRKRFLNERLGVDMRGFFGQYIIRYDPANFSVPSSSLPGGIGVDQKYYSYRTGASIDTDISLPAGIRLLVGGEVFYDWMPVNYAVYRVLPALLNNVANCPPPRGDNPCPVVVHHASNRLSSGVFASVQYRPIQTLAFSGGVRAQFAAGKRAFDPVMLLEGAAVWTFMPEWNLKLNYAEGYRPPSLLKTDNGNQVTWAGNPDLQVERSRAVQGEINARLLQDVGAIRQLTIRADVAYTWVDDFISIIDSRFLNISKIGIQVVELLAKLSFKRGHSLSLGYTLNDATSDEDGKVKSLPAQWLTMTAALNLWKRRLWFTTNVSFIGAWENPNHYPARSAGKVRLGNLDQNGQPIEQEILGATWPDRVMDRVGSSVLWNAGVRFAMPKLHTQLLADFYNILDSRSYYGEGFYDLTAQFEPISAPWMGMSFMLRAKVTL